MEVQESDYDPELNAYTGIRDTLGVFILGSLQWIEGFSTFVLYLSSYTS